MGQEGVVGAAAGPLGELREEEELYVVSMIGSRQGCWTGLN